MSRTSLSNLTKPALILVSTFMLVHAVAFFIEHTKSDDSKTYTMEVLSITAPSQNMIPELVLTVERKPMTKNYHNPATPIIKVDTIKVEKISPSGELIP